LVHDLADLCDASKVVDLLAASAYYFALFSPESIIDVSLNLLEFERNSRRNSAHVVTQMNKFSSGSQKKVYPAFVRFINSERPLTWPFFLKVIIFDFSGASVLQGNRRPGIHESVILYPSRHTGVA